MPSFFWLATRGYRDCSRAKFWKHFVPPGFLLGRREEVRGWMEPPRLIRAAEPQRRGTPVPARSRRWPARECAAAYSPLPTRPEPRSIAFLLTAWKSPRRPLSRHLGIREGRAARLAGRKAVGRHQDLLRACLSPGAKDCTLDTPSPAYRKSQTTSTRIAGLLPNAWSL